MILKYFYCCIFLIFNLSLFSQEVIIKTVNGDLIKGDKVTNNKTIKTIITRNYYKPDSSYQILLNKYNQENKVKLENFAKRLKNTKEEIDLIHDYMYMRMSNEILDTVERYKKLTEIALQIYTKLKTEYDNPVLKQNSYVDSVWSLAEKELSEQKFQLTGYNPKPFDELYFIIDDIVIRFKRALHDFLEANDHVFPTKGIL